MFVTMERGNSSGSRRSKEIMEEDQNELISTMQSLCIQVSGIYSQFLSIMELIIHHQQGQQQMQDECATLRSQIEEHQLHPSTNTPSRTTFETL
jgi:hypothetical protein